VIELNPTLKGVCEQMRGLGLGALAHANQHATFAPIPNEQWPQLSVLQAAHAAELLIKARIAEEHPLLVFEQLSSLKKTPGEDLDFQDLFEHGGAVQWADLPGRLWAATGISLPNRSAFDQFGRLRNGIQHFAPVSGRDLNEETLRFIYSVIDPFIHECWGLFAIDFYEDPEIQHTIDSLVNHEILFLVFPEAAEVSEDWPVDWSKASEKYRNEMRERIQKALSIAKKQTS
jgi:hypothetical protein